MAKKVKTVDEAIALILKNIELSDHNTLYLKDVTADTMQEVIQENVYNAFEPKEYVRRGAEDGFLDTNNMVFTNVQSNGNAINLTFENITTGNDSMSGERIDAMLENGIRDNWDDPDVMDRYGRINSDARPFIDDTVEALQNSKGELVNAFKKDLKNMGFDVK